MRTLLRHHDIRLLLAGQTASMLGDWLLVLVLGMWAKQLSGSNTVAGGVLLAGAAPSLLAPVGGWLADRVRRRRLMLTVDAATGAAVGLLLLVHDRSQLWLLYVVALACGVSKVVFSPAMRGLVQQLVPPDSLGAANAALTTVRQALRLVGPLAGAALFTRAGGGTVACIDVSTFGVSIASLTRLHHRQPPPEPGSGRASTDLAAGILHLRRSRLLWRMTVSSAIAMLALGLSESVFFAVLDGLDKPVGFLGVISTFQGIGAMAAGVAVTSLLRRCGEVRLLLIALGTATVAALAVDSTAVVVVLIGAAMFGAALPGLIVASTTMLQQRTPNPVMGRTAAAFDLATGLPYALSIGLGAVLLAFVSYRAIILGMAAGLALATFLAAQWLPPAAEPATPPPIATLGRRPCPAGVAPSAP